MPALDSRRRGFCDADQYAVPEPRLGPHTRGGNGYTVQSAQYDDDDLVFQRDLIGRPFCYLDNAKASESKCLTVRRLAPAAIDDENRALLVAAIRIRRHTSAIGN